MKPGTARGEKTVRYLTAQFQKMGLKPGNPDGTFIQNVPLVGFQAKQVTGAFQAGEKAIALSFPTDFVAVSRRLSDKAVVEKSDVARGLRSGRSRIRLGRLQGLGRSRQDLDHAGQRPSRGRSQRRLQARPGVFQGAGHDLLRALDVAA